METSLLAMAPCATAALVLFVIEREAYRKWPPVGYVYKSKSWSVDESAEKQVKSSEEDRL